MYIFNLTHPVCMHAYTRIYVWCKYIHKEAPSIHPIIHRMFALEINRHSRASDELLTILCLYICDLYLCMHVCLIYSIPSDMLLGKIYVYVRCVTCLLLISQGKIDQHTYSACTLQNIHLYTKCGDKLFVFENRFYRAHSDLNNNKIAQHLKVHWMSHTNLSTKYSTYYINTIILSS